MVQISNQKSHDNPLVSVACITYNHEKFIAQAIESVLMQVTDFPVELVIGEDCSTDGTRAIVQEYAVKYPGVIRPLLPDKNLGMAENYEAVRLACRGKYIAWLRKKQRMNGRPCRSKDGFPEQSWVPCLNARIFIS